MPPTRQIDARVGAPDGQPSTWDAHSGQNPDVTAPLPGRGRRRDTGREFGGNTQPVPGTQTWPRATPGQSPFGQWEGRGPAPVGERTLLYGTNPQMARGPNAHRAPNPQPDPRPFHSPEHRSFAEPNEVPTRTSLPPLQRFDSHGELAPHGPGLVEAAPLHSSPGQVDPANWGDWTTSTGTQFRQQSRARAPVVTSLVILTLLITAALSGAYIWRGQRGPLFNANDVDAALLDRVREHGKIVAPERITHLLDSGPFLAQKELVAVTDQRVVYLHDRQRESIPLTEISSVKLQPGPGPLDEDHILVASESGPGLDIEVGPLRDLGPTALVLTIERVAADARVAARAALEAEQAAEKARWAREAEAAAQARAEAEAAAAAKTKKKRSRKRRKRARKGRRRG